MKAVLQHLRNQTALNGYRAMSQELITASNAAALLRTDLNNMYIYGRCMQRP